MPELMSVTSGFFSQMWRRCGYADGQVVPNVCAQVPAVREPSAQTYCQRGFVAYHLVIAGFDQPASQPLQLLPSLDKEAALRYLRRYPLAGIPGPDVHYRQQRQTSLTSGVS